MSAARKCDRCGTFYDLGAGAFRLERLGSMRKPERSEFMKEEPGIGVWEMVHLYSDLCPACGQHVSDALQPPAVSR
jgi:hypothetical protein